MNATKLIALVLIAGGALALIYGGFSYTQDSTAVKLGPLELTVKEKKTVNVPRWGGCYWSWAGAKAERLSVPPLSDPGGEGFRHRSRSGQQSQCRGRLVQRQHRFAQVQCLCPVLFAELF